jgi:predicted metal-dependent phosphotriesterase family hydrolase
MSRIVRTVCGDIAPEELGSCDSHEHLFLATPLQPDEDILDVAKAAEEAQTLRDAGGCALVDWTPLGLGRSIEGLTTVAEATGLHVVAATGLHRDAHYLPDDPLRAYSVEKLTEQFVADLERCGIIKIGASYHRLRPFEEKAFEAAAAAHAYTGVPVCVHTEHGTMGLGIVERLVALGVPAHSIVLAHLDRNPDSVEHAEIGVAGAWLQFDGVGRTKYWPDSTILGLISDLCDRGFGGRLLLGGDTGRASMMRSYGGGPGLDYLFARFKPRLERELGEDLSRQVFVANPAAAFSFMPRAAVDVPLATTSAGRRPSVPR